ncbi:MAG TPA: glycosyltransferase family 39 protein, partial [Blastocatellia bacterium]|nr:glycosyltransferase family 39 protein [Blastocatellia bacterium]
MADYTERGSRGQTKPGGLKNRAEIITRRSRAGFIRRAASIIFNRMISNSSGLSSLASGARSWAARALAVETKDAQRMKRPGATALIFVTLFLAALGVRLLHWQDLRVEMEKGEGLLATLGRPYRQEAKRMREQGGLLFPSEPVKDGDARLIVHPPGYSILIFIICGAFDDTTAMVWFQIIFDALAAALLFLMAAEIFSLTPAAIAGSLAALSPHLAHYSLWLTPESLASALVLAAVYLLIRARKRPRFVTVVSAGLLLGLSCWLRANGLLLAPFLAVVILLVFDDRRLRLATAFTAAALLAVAPITIRNALVYRHFIPLSLGAGITLIEGIGEYDKEGRFGLPATDKETVEKDAEWHGKPEYRRNLWTPDGVERDRYRFSRGLEVARSNPGWFVGVMLDRAAGMVRYNDSFGHGRHWHIGAVST